MKDKYGRMGAIVIAGLVGAGFCGYAMMKGAVEPFNGSVMQTLALGFATGCVAGAFLTLYDKVQTWKKSDDRDRWQVRRAGLLEFAWWVLLVVGSIAIMGAATFIFT